MSKVFEIKLAQIPAGISVSHAEKGQTVQVQTSGFMSWEDGEQFHDLLDSFASDVLRALPKESHITPENVGSFIAIISPGGAAKVIVRPEAIASVKTSKSKIEKGEPVFEKDIVDVQKLNFKDVEIQDNCGVIVVLAYQWRRCCFFDFGPLIGDKEPRDFDLSEVFGASWRRLMFSHLYKINDAEWARFFNQKWFPFSSISPHLKKNLVKSVKHELKISRHIDELKKDIDSRLADFEEIWKAKAAFSPHLQFFLKATEHYRNEDYLSCLAILVPRIEGVMRTLLPEGVKRNQKTLAEIVSSGSVNDPMSALFPERFREYLETVFFASFDPAAPEGISRNTVSHGVAPVTNFDLEAALISIFTLQQIANCIP